MGGVLWPLTLWSARSFLSFCPPPPVHLAFLILLRELTRQRVVKFSPFSISLAIHSFSRSLLHPIGFLEKIRIYLLWRFSGFILKRTSLIWANANFQIRIYFFSFTSNTWKFIHPCLKFLAYQTKILVYVSSSSAKKYYNLWIDTRCEVHGEF